MFWLFIEAKEFFWIFHSKEHIFILSRDSIWHCLSHSSWLCVTDPWVSPDLTLRTIILQNDSLTNQRCRIYNFIVVILSQRNLLKCWQEFGRPIPGAGTPGISLGTTAHSHMTEKGKRINNRKDSHHPSFFSALALQPPVLTEPLGKATLSQPSAWKHTLKPLKVIML